MSVCVLVLVGVLDLVAVFVGVVTCVCVLDSSVCWWFESV